jgi:hypothetical protein
MSNPISKIPFIHDISLDNLWVLPTTTGCAYLLSPIMQEIFPLASVPDQWPLFVLRSRLAKVHHEVFRRIFPEYYHVIHVVVKGNLPLATFLMTLYVLKESNHFLRYDFSFTLPVTYALCIVLSIIRDLASIILQNIAQQFSSRGFIQLARKIDTFANKINSSGLSWSTFPDNSL